MSHKETSSQASERDYALNIGDVPPSLDFTCLYTGRSWGLDSTRSKTTNKSKRDHQPAIKPEVLRSRGLTISPNGVSVIGKDRESSNNINSDFSVSHASLLINGFLGSGEHAEVLRAMHVPTGTEVAVKTSDILERESRHQMLTEIKAFTTFDCPFIVNFYGAYLHESRVHTVLELMNRGSLADVVTNYGPLPIQLVQFIASQLVGGLCYLHGKFKVHRDFKPSNVLLDDLGNVKISDFGLMLDLPDAKATATANAGTLKFFSPERLRGDPFGLPSDIWALGLTIVYAATGVVPIAQDEWKMFEQFENPANCRFLPHNPNIFPKAFRRFIDGCLEFDPDKRKTCCELKKSRFLANVFNNKAWKKLITDRRSTDARFQQRRSSITSSVRKQGLGVNALSPHSISPSSASSYRKINNGERRKSSTVFRWPMNGLENKINDLSPESALNLTPGSLDSELFNSTTASANSPNLSVPPPLELLEDSSGGTSGNVARRRSLLRRRGSRRSIRSAMSNMSNMSNMSALSMASIESTDKQVSIMLHGKQRGFDYNYDTCTWLGDPVTADNTELLDDEETDTGTYHSLRIDSSVPSSITTTPDQSKEPSPREPSQEHHLSLNTNQPVDSSISPPSTLSSASSSASAQPPTHPLIGRARKIHAKRAESPLGRYLKQQGPRNPHPQQQTVQLLRSTASHNTAKTLFSLGGSQETNGDPAPIQIEKGFKISGDHLRVQKGPKGASSRWKMQTRSLGLNESEGNDERKRSETFSVGLKGLRTCGNSIDFDDNASDISDSVSQFSSLRMSKPSLAPLSTEYAVRKPISFITGSQQQQQQRPYLPNSFPSNHSPSSSTRSSPRHFTRSRITPFHQINHPQPQKSIFQPKFNGLLTSAIEQVTMRNRKREILKPDFDHLELESIGSGGSYRSVRSVRSLHSMKAPNYRGRRPDKKKTIARNKIQKKKHKQNISSARDHQPKRKAKGLFKHHSSERMPHKSNVSNVRLLARADANKSTGLRLIMKHSRRTRPTKALPLKNLTKP